MAVSAAVARVDGAAMAARRGSPDGQAGDVAAGVEFVADERAAGATRPRDQAGQRKRGLVAGAAHAAGPATAELYFGLFMLRTAGAYLYDAAGNRSRVDRADGRGDRYCGTAAPLSATPCSHLVVGGVRYLLFPDLRYCCTCCTAANGCGIVARDWLAGAAYLGSDEVDGIVCDKWNKPGLQNNYYWQTPAGVPIRIYQEYAEMMTFRPDTYTTSPDFVDNTFALPEYSDCKSACYGTCLIAAQESIGKGHINVAIGQSYELAYSSSRLLQGEKISVMLPLSARAM
eukprot:SM000023S07594  [mRNA]  locus=s23:368569:371303:+ [translate_table: standard]